MSRIERDSPPHMARVEELRRLGAPWDDLEQELASPGSVDMVEAVTRRNGLRWVEAKSPQPNAPGRRLAVVSVADINPEPVPWLWNGWIARGALTVVTGHPDVGKSFFTLAVAAALTRGSRLYGDPTERQPGQILLVGAEDPIKYVVRPRLDSLDADVTRVRAIKGTAVDDSPEQHFSLVEDLDLLDLELSLAHYEVVVIDPLNAYLADTDTHRDAAVRSVLSPLSALAERRDVAVIALIHPTKGARDLPLYRIQGSVANSAACRTAILIGRDQANDGEVSPRRHVVLLKNNLMADEDKPSPICFELTRESGFRWVGVSGATAAQILSGPEDEESKSSLDQAKDFLQELLADGPVESNEVWKAARATGIAERTLKRAKEQLGVEAHHKIPGDPKSPWQWEPAPRGPRKPLGGQENVWHSRGDVGPLGANSDTALRHPDDLEPCPSCGKREGYDEDGGRRTCAECGHQWGVPA